MYNHIPISRALDVMIMRYAPEGGGGGGCSGCESGCSGTCSGGCTGTCAGTCSDTCSGTCAGSCAGGCYGGCSGSCKGTCTSSCDGYCQTTCQNGGQTVGKYKSGKYKFNWANPLNSDSTIQIKASEMRKLADNISSLKSDGLISSSVPTPSKTNVEFDKPISATIYNNFGSAIDKMGGSVDTVTGGVKGTVIKPHHFTDLSSGYNNASIRDTSCCELRQSCGQTGCVSEQH